MAHSTWKAIGKPKLQLVKMQLTGFADNIASMLSRCKVLVYILDTSYVHTFYEMPKNTTKTLMIFDEPWQRKYNYTLNWHEEEANIIIGSTKFLLPLLNAKATRGKAAPIINKQVPQAS